MGGFILFEDVIGPLFEATLLAVKYFLIWFGMYLIFD